MGLRKTTPMRACTSRTPTGSMCRFFLRDDEQQLRCDRGRGEDRMRYLISAIAFAAVTANVASAVAQSYPSRPITVIVPFAACGATDVSARIVGQNMRRTLGQRIIVENIVGAGGTAGPARPMRGNPDS